MAALEQFNAQARPPEVVIIIRGGGSAEDLAAFSTEPVTRAVAASRVPTLVAIGHEVDLGLAELAADRRASTPSNAAELLVPDRRQVTGELKDFAKQLEQQTRHQLQAARQQLEQQAEGLGRFVEQVINSASTTLKSHRQLLAALNPTAVLRRGYATVRSGDSPSAVYSGA